MGGNGWLANKADIVLESGLTATAGYMLVLSKAVCAAELKGQQ